MAGDIQVVAEIDDKKFIDGLERLKAQVASYQAENVRRDADVIDAQIRNQRTVSYVTVKGQQESGRAIGLTSNQWLRMGTVAIAAVTGAVYAGRKAIEAYAKETGLAADGVKQIEAAMRETTLAAGRFAQAADLQPKIEAAYRFRAALIDIGREMLQTVASFGDVKGAAEYTDAAKQREAAEREAKAIDDARRAAGDQAGRRAGLRGDTVEQARAQARAEYEARVKAINEMQISGSQKADLIKGERGIRDETVRKAIREEEEKRTQARVEMQKQRREAAEAEAEAMANKDKEARREADAVEQRRQALELDVRRLEIENLRAQGKDKEAEKAKILLEYEQRMKELEESGLGALTRGQFADQFARARDIQLAGVDREKEKQVRDRLSEVSVLGGNSSILAQAFGGAPAQGKDQVAEIKRTNEILKSIERKIGEPAPAVLG